MKLLEKITSIDFSDTEKDRITKSLLDNKSIQYRVLTTKAQAIHDLDFWGRAQRYFHVTGFRDGNPKAVAMVLDRALEGLKMTAERTPHAGWPLIWPLYMRAVQLYLHDDLHQLGELVRSEDLQLGPGTVTEQILRSIVKALPLHDATIDQVRELYDLWGFERTSYVDEILAAATVDADAVRRLIAESVGTMRREITAAVSSTRSDLIRQLDQRQAEISSLRTEFERARTEFDDAIAHMDALRAQTSASRTGAERTRASDGVERPTNDQHTAEALAGIQTRFESMGRQFKELRTRVEHLEVPAPVPRTNTAQATPISARTVLTSWIEKLPNLGLPSVSINSAWLLLEIVRRSRILIADMPALFTALFKSLPATEVRNIAVSPTWLDESDWKEPLAFISEDALAPRLLIVSDFDVALQETYLIPALINWLAVVPPECANRILLVTSSSEMGAVSPRVFELATVISREGVCIRELRRLGDSVADSPPTLDVEQVGATVLRYSRSRNAAYEAQLRQYASNYGVALPARVLENFVSVYDGLRTSLRSRDAGQIAQEACLDPWVETARGEAVARTLQEALKEVLTSG